MCQDVVTPGLLAFVIHRLQQHYDTRMSRWICAIKHIHQEKLKREDGIDGKKVFFFLYEK